MLCQLPVVDGKFLTNRNGFVRTILPFEEALSALPRLSRLRDASVEVRVVPCRLLT
jgi:hypothetical protein